MTEKSNSEELKLLKHKINVFSTKLKRAQKTGEILYRHERILNDWEMLFGKRSASYDDVYSILKDACSHLSSAHREAKYSSGKSEDFEKITSAMLKTLIVLRGVMKNGREKGLKN